METRSSTRKKLVIQFTKGYKKSIKTRPSRRKKLVIQATNNSGTETRSSKRRKLSIQATNDNRGISSKTDRITDLPEEILHQILNLLPIQRIAQSAVLSKRWRSIWSSYPDLDFTTHHTRIYLLADINAETNLINEVLALRDKKSDLRLLRFCAQLSFYHLNCILRRAVRHNVQELDIEITTEDTFNLPRCIMNSESLKVLNLKCKSPGRFPLSLIMKWGFQSLRGLSLSYIGFRKESSLLDFFNDSVFPFLTSLSIQDCFGLVYLRVNIGRLQDLALKNCYQLRRFEVEGPEIGSLSVAGCFDRYFDKSYVKINGPKLSKLVWESNYITEKCCLEELVCLKEASVGFSYRDLKSANLSSVWDLFDGCSPVSCLKLDSKCIEILSSVNHLTVPLKPFNNLKSLELHIDFNKNSGSGLACLFGSSPTLHTLILIIANPNRSEKRLLNVDQLWGVAGSDEEQFWESQAGNLQPFLHNLQVVKFNGFLECRNEISLAKFFLKHGKALQLMNIFLWQCNTKDSLPRQRLRVYLKAFTWASSDVKFYFQ